MEKDYFSLFDKSDITIELSHDLKTLIIERWCDGKVISTKVVELDEE